MANRNLEKLASIDAQLRLLVPGKVSEDDKLIEYDALLLDRFLDILQDLHGEDLRETVSLSLLLSLNRFLDLGLIGPTSLRYFGESHEAKHENMQWEFD